MKYLAKLLNTKKTLFLEQGTLPDIKKIDITMKEK